MQYNKKTWVNRETEYPNQYRMVSTNGNIANVSIVPESGAVTVEGEKFDADTMNDMETRINSGFNAVNTDISTQNTTLRGLITAETTRATGEENLINSSITQLNADLADEVARATGAEDALSTDMSGFTSRITAAESDIDSLDDRMTNAESDIDTFSSRVAGLETSISLETDRAESAETTLQGNIDTVSSAISGEVSRATTAETALQTSIAALESMIGQAYKPGGSVYFAALPPLMERYLGYVYNIKDDFTTTSDFLEGAGISYPLGTNVAIVAVPEVVYHEVIPVGDENPSELGWYEYDSVEDVYFLSEDTEVESEKTYYIMTNATLYYDVLAGNMSEGFYLEQDNITLSTSAQTTVTFTDARILTTSTVEAYTTVDGIDYAAMVISAGSCVITFDEVETAITISVKIWVR